MEEQICQYCQSPINAKGFFCPNCTHQIRCKECKQTLELNAKACIYCGTNTLEVSGSKFPTTSNINQIEFNETKTTRQLKASFTDAVGENFGGILGHLLLQGVTNPRSTSRKFEKSSSIEDINAEYLHGQAEQDTIPAGEENSNTKILTQGNTAEDSELKLIMNIFRFEGDKIILIDSRLKATTKIDYCKRLILLYLYGNRLMGKESVSRSSVTRLLEDAGLNNPNTRTWIAKNNCTRSDEEKKSIELIIPGIEEAKRYLNEFNNPDIENKWLITTQPKHRKKSKKSELENDDEVDG